MSLAFVLSVAAVQEKNPIEAKALLSTGNVTLVDVRSEAAYRAEHVEGAVLQSHVDLSGCTSEEIAFYCSAGTASTAAAQSHEADTGNSHVYAFGTLDDLKSANISTTSGMPASHEVQCSGTGDGNASLKLARLGRSAWCLVPVAALMGFVMFWRRRRRITRQAEPSTAAQHAMAKATAIEQPPAEQPVQ